MDQSLGSQGIVGSADTIILLQRDIDSQTGERKNTGKLYATCRSIKDVLHKVEYSPSFGMWGITDKPIEPECPQNTDESDSNPGQTKNVITREMVRKDL
jgi:hypothetical protein